MGKKLKERKWTIIVLLSIIAQIIIFSIYFKQINDQLGQMEHKQIGIEKSLQDIVSDKEDYRKVVLQLQNGNKYDLEQYSVSGETIYSSKEHWIEISNYIDLYDITGTRDGERTKQLTNIHITTAEKYFTPDSQTMIIETPDVEKVEDFKNHKNPNANVYDIAKEKGLTGGHILVTSVTGVPIALYQYEFYSTYFMDNINIQVIQLDDEEVYVQNGIVENIFF